MKYLTNIADLIEISKHKDAVIGVILETAFERGLIAGKELAKEKIIEAIIKEK